MMIRRFTVLDMESVLNIWLDASIDAHNFIEKAFWESKIDDMREIYLPMAETHVYEDQGEVKGFISLYHDTIAAVFVAPVFQGQGIGSQLIKKAKSIRHSLTLTVYRDNKKSIAFYEKCNFQITGEQLDVHTGNPEIVMSYAA